MKKKILSLLILISMSAASICSSAQQSDTYFPYPTVPDEINTLSGRCNYLVCHFWERCDLKQSFSSLDRLDKAFGDWVSFMPYATSDTVFMSIDKYLTDVAKIGGDNMLQVAKMAEKWTYCDSAEYFSEELYLPFCKAAAAHKKMPKADKLKYETQQRILESSGLGKRVPDLDLTTPDGNTINLRDVIASRLILIFSDPECFDCNLARTRLAADYNLKQLSTTGLVKVICLYPGIASDKWKAEAETYPENWIAGAMSDADKYFDMSTSPSIYYLDARHKVLGKNIDVNNLLFAIQQINQQMQQ